MCEACGCHPLRQNCNVQGVILHLCGHRDTILQRVIHNSSIPEVSRGYFSVVQGVHINMRLGGKNMEVHIHRG